MSIAPQVWSGQFTRLFNTNPTPFKWLTKLATAHHINFLSLVLCYSKPHDLSKPIRCKL